jgi:hypothetical protein
MFEMGGLSVNATAGWLWFLASFHLSVATIAAVRRSVADRK